MWLVAPVIAVGLGTWIGFLFIGLRAKRKLWLTYAVAYFVATIALMYLVSAVPTGTKEEPENTWVGGVLIAFWAAGVVHSALTNKAWLRHRAYRRSDSTSTPAPLKPPSAQEHAGRELKATEISQRDPIDINSADVDALVAAGLAAEEADAVVRARALGGDYAQVTDLISRADLPPHRFAMVRTQLVALRRNSRSSTTPSSGRRLDL
ncbi:hypothetical protein [Agrococcus lahaulensis]|uniref:hypothetical protein n=1 Tax=Agrococcus lahaulensis TaxID=341722 RepID=UPI0012ECB244|nr:hypothetical protein [Agrococcus lahaulensis]